MSEVNAAGDKRVAMVHDLFLELGRVELLLDRQADAASCEHARLLQARRSELLRRLDRVAV